jgi:hypothetical protein
MLQRSRKPTSFEALKFDFSKYHRARTKPQALQSCDESEDDDELEEAQPRKYKCIDRVLDAYISYCDLLQETLFLDGGDKSVQRWVSDTFNTS